MVVSACGAASADTAPDNPDTMIQSESIMQCRMNAIAEPLAGIPAALKKAAEVYQALDSTDNAVGAFESVYGKSVSTFTYDEQAEVLLILSGLDSCGEVSATTPGDIALLLSGQPSGGTVAGQPAKPTSEPSKSPIEPNKPPSEPSKTGKSPSASNEPPPDTTPSEPTQPPPDTTPSEPNQPPSKPKPKRNKPYDGLPMQMRICTSPEDWSAESPSCVPVNMLPGRNRGNTTQQETTGSG